MDEIRRYTEYMNYYEVAPNAIVRAGQPTLTYSSEQPLEVGQIVTVPAGKRQLIGVIMHATTKPDYTVKPVEKVLDIAPLPDHLVAIADWLSTYYATPLATVWQTILPRGLTKKRRKSVISTSVHKRQRTNIVFTADQQHAIDTIDTMSTGTALLHGVTGSGKTAVYIELAKKQLAAGKSTIVLVPEIALTSQLVAEFHNHFDNIILTHSRQTEAERHLAWQAAIKADQPQVVIGPRSALFMPLHNLGLVVIDECHEPSFKQDQSPRYSALRVAAVICDHVAGKLVLGSATPSISDYYLAQQSQRPIITMSSPARSDTVKPTISLVDMTKRDNFHRHRFLSDQLLAKIDSSLERSQQSLIFHNRRGSASTSMCDNCGWQAGCSHCFVPLTLHGDKHTLLCHVCGRKAKVPTSCPECGSTDVVHKGIGTKLIESELRRLYPDANIARFDGDADKLQTISHRYSDIYDGSIDIIIGTQVVAKGLDLPKLRVVGVIQADAGLSLPDYTSPERTFQLLHQVIGRVGRSHHATEVVVQSYQPNNPAVTDGIAQNYSDFYQRTLALRRHTNFPPFTYLLKLTCIYKTEAATVKNSRQLAQTLRSNYPDIEILGPMPSFYERQSDTYRWQLVLKANQRQLLLDALQHLPSSHWQYELDPWSLL